MKGTGKRAQEHGGANKYEDTFVAKFEDSCLTVV